MGKQVKKYKKSFDYSYSLGVFPTIELLNYRSESVLEVVISPRGEINQGVSEIKEICKSRNIKVRINDKLIGRLSPKENCYAIGVFRKFQTQLNLGKNHLVLVNPSNMGNLGTIIRTMSGFNIDSLGLIEPSVDIFNPSVIRSSMGSVFQIFFRYFSSIDEYIRSFDNNLYTFMTNGEQVLHEVSLKEPFTLVFGNESSGLPDDYLKLGTSVNIPHSKNVDSLNLSIAVGIGLYEASRQAFPTR